MQTGLRTDDERLVWSVEEAGRRLGISRADAYELVDAWRAAAFAAGAVNALVPWHASSRCWRASTRRRDRSCRGR